MEGTGNFFWKKKKISAQSEARVIGRADRLSMCVLYTGPKRFQRLNQMLCLLSLFPLSNFTFAIEKEINLSLPDNTEIYELSSPTEKGGDPHQATTLGCPLGSSRRHMDFLGHPFDLTQKHGGQHSEVLWGD